MLYVESYAKFIELFPMYKSQVVSWYGYGKHPHGIKIELNTGVELYFIYITDNIWQLNSTIKGSRVTMC